MPILGFDEHILAACTERAYSLLGHSGVVSVMDGQEDDFLCAAVDFTLLDVNPWSKPSSRRLNPRRPLDYTPITTR